VGGLGNRLFTLCAGWQLASQLCRPLRVLGGAPSLLDSLGGFESQWLGPVTYIQSRPSAQAPPAIASRAWRRFVRAISSGAAGSVSAGSLAFGDSGVNYLEISGYFQDANQVISATRLGWPSSAPALDVVPEGLQELVQECETTRPIAVHVRLGDYALRTNRRRIGRLPKDYFRRALEFVRREVNADGPAWLFSDDIHQAAGILESLGERSFRPIALTQSAASISLMSRCRGLVLSNSTFSWWAGFWSSGVVACPSPWNRMELGADLILPGWHTEHVSAWR
jgi:hypothetical protein